MTTKIRSALLHRGLAADRIRAEHFTAPPSGPRTGPVTDRHAPRITFVHNGASCTVVAHLGETVLDSGLRASLDLPYSCRAGICGTRRAVTLSGPGPQAVLACQTYPAPGAVADFDAVRVAE